MSYNTFSVCAEDGNRVVLTEEEQDGFKFTDNTDGPNGPDDEEAPDDDVPLFSDTPTEIPKSPDNRPYTVIINTPEDKDDTPMSVNTVVRNVKKIVVYIDGETLIEVDKSFLSKQN